MTHSGVGYGFLESGQSTSYVAWAPVSSSVKGKLELPGFIGRGLVGEVGVMPGK